MASKYLLPVVLFVSACGPKPEPEPEPPTFDIVTSGLPGALFAVSGRAADDVWVVGANDGDRPTAWHWDGTAWDAVNTGLDTGDLYWVHVADDVAYLGGTSGTIVRIAGAEDGAAMSTPGTDDVWGIWSPGAGDAWAVGGQPSGGARGFVWRLVDGAWEAQDLGENTPRPAAWYKVWGTAADDVWFCGTDGALMHWDGAAFEAVDSGTTRTLLTLSGRADGSVVTAVGGQFSATVVESTGGADFVDVTPGPDAPLQTFGVHHRGELAYAVGMRGVVLERSSNGWMVDEDAPALPDALHSVWIDPDGGVWAAGGRITSPPLIDGTLVYRGAAKPAPIE